MILRPYTAADFEALYALEEQCFQPPFRFPRRYMRSLIAATSAAVRVVEVDGVLAGFGIVSWSRRSAIVAAYIETIEVAPASRGLGIGRALLADLERAAEAAGASILGLHVDAENASAIRLYESAGYQWRRRQEDFYPHGRAALVYTRDLVPNPLPEPQS